MATLASVPSRAAEPAPILLSATVLGFRAAQLQRRDDQTSMVAAADLSLLLDEFERRAASGDSDAAARMREIYDECAGALTFRPPNATEIKRVYILGPEQLPLDDPQRAAAIALTQARCAKVLPGADERTRITATIRAMSASQRLAADLGDLPARIAEQRFEVNPQLRAQHEREYARLLLQSGAPEDLFALFQRAPEGTRFSAEAWGLAACNRGHPCTDMAFIRQQFCVQFGSECTTRSLGEYLQRSLPPRAWRRALAERDEILASPRSGDTERLLRPADPGGGGG